MPSLDRDQREREREKEKERPRHTKINFVHTFILSVTKVDTPSHVLHNVIDSE